MQDSALIIFIKNIEKGKVKTRLAATVGHDQAMKIYLELLKHTRKIAQSLPVTKLLFYSQFIENEDDWSNNDFEKLLQINAGLGEKMAAAFEEAFKKYHKVVIVGSDCASLTTEIMEDAFKQLENHDFVIGPALDGGYYLIGMNQFLPAVFENIEWSTETVFPKTVENIEQINKSFALLPTLSDIDYEEDWEKYGWAIEE